MSSTIIAGDRSVTRMASKYYGRCAYCLCGFREGRQIALFRNPIHIHHIDYLKEKGWENLRAMDWECYEKYLRNSEFHKCVYCSSDEDLTIDHVVARNGENDIPSNLVTSCRSCNSAKGKKDQLRFIQEDRRATAARELIEQLPLFSGNQISAWFGDPA